ncbi:hypothetical protein M2451_000388 [Dysgonomonas sp. PFB1-18]|nr:hypothetical protein [Dysgonomonas sp. PF1-14]MDH6337857.1 hypothetical protein [Dysgonomonas sp. PF1-16]MDH6379081.1 hypothetical protein [Dysgonomonas sp. PFB1-18]MDH6396716.1 hypothetical protein [Dysgonomonas sp. PF1-23]
MIWKLKTYFACINLPILPMKEQKEIYYKIISKL